MSLESIVPFAARLIAEAVRPGDVALDGTLGNGRDAIHLARLVGPSGRVHAFEVQPRAVREADAALRASGLRDRVTIHEAGHERLDGLLPPTLRFRAAMFNLGYLPGGDRAIVTRAETTIPALAGAFARLEGGGLLTVVVYPGHAGGASERDAVVAWAASLAPTRAKALRYEFLDPRGGAPLLLAIESKPARGRGSEFPPSPEDS